VHALTRAALRLLSLRALASPAQTAELAALSSMAHDAAAAWRELEAVAGGATLLLPCGTLDLAPEGSPLLDALDAAATAGSLGGASPLSRFGGRAALAARWPALAAAPRGWEARFDGGGGALCVVHAAGALLARAERAGAFTRWDDAPLAACEDRGGSFRLAFATPRADAAAATSDAGDWDWVEVEQVLLAPERAGDARATLERLLSPLLLPVRFRIRAVCVCAVVCVLTGVCVHAVCARGVWRVAPARARGRAARAARLARAGAAARR
jgi:hypothetical protein